MSKQYECIVFGATGYTGKYTCEHIATHLPTDFKWAISGRSESKLKALADELRQLNPDRIQPAIEVSQLNKGDLARLASKTKVLVSTVGPYHRHGSAAFAACAESGTHYLDCTGEVPWVYEMVKKYENIAQKTGAIMIPQNGVESVPADLMCWMLVNHIRRALGTGTAELINVIWSLNSAPSGGTLDTVFSLLETYSLIQVARAMSPFSLTTITPPKQHRSKPLTELLSGVRTHKDLGLLTDSISGPTDAPIVNRSWSLIDGGKFYGPRFQLSSYMRAKNMIHGLIVHFALTFGLVALVFPPFRWVAKKFVYQPGQGPTKEQASKEHCEWRAVAKADASDPNDPKKAFGRVRWNGSMYGLTGAFLAEAAVTIARDQVGLKGGITTPATLGASYLERLQKAGLQTEVRILP